MEKGNNNNRKLYEYTRKLTRRNTVITHINKKYWEKYLLSKTEITMEQDTNESTIDQDLELSKEEY